MIWLRIVRVLLTNLMAVCRVLDGWLHGEKGFWQRDWTEDPVPWASWCPTDAKRFQTIGSNAPPHGSTLTTLTMT